MTAADIKEITALLQLVDDPDNEIFETVANRLITYGKDIIPRLENLWENSPNSEVLARIEHLIHRVHFQDLYQELSQWTKEKEPSLLSFAILISKYLFPDLDVELIHSEINQIKKSIWLELNNYLSPLEQVHIINSILFNYYKFKGEENVNTDVCLFCLNYLLDTKKGNSFSLGLLFLIICESLDIPIFGIDLPRQFILGYFDSLYHFMNPDRSPVQSIQFYIDPVDGMIYTHNDVMTYLQKINAASFDHHHLPLSSLEIGEKLLKELANTFVIHHQKIKAEEINQLLLLFKENNEPRT